MSNGPSTHNAADTAASAGRAAVETDMTTTMPRSASYSQLPMAASKNLPQRNSSLSRSFSENVLANMQGKLSRHNTTEQQSGSSLKARRSLRSLSSIKRPSTRRESEPHFTKSKFNVGPDNSPPERQAHEPKTDEAEVISDRERKTRSVSGSLSNFARKSWISASRSPSPSPSKRRARQERDVDADSENKYPGKPKPTHDAYNGHANGHVKAPSRRNSLLRRGSRRPLSSILSKTPGPETPSVPTIPKSFSTDRLPSLNHKSSGLSNPPVPSVKSFERLQGSGTETPKKKDALWSAFRSLDGEFQKFQSRPSTLKTAVVRSALLPFLKTYADHPSTSSLRPEDLDRRTVILNKWWTGLLEMLNGRHGESVSGNDRPTVLEAVTALIVRSEWTLPAIAITSKAGQVPKPPLKSRSTTSLGSTMTMSSDFLADSVYHNVRNIFTQNLLAQMAYAVDKMSSRNVPASVVTFCGRATAYAFFYCDGVAEILVRLWAITPDTMRRVIVEAGLRKDVKIDSVMLDRISGTFPPCLNSLRFKALRPMMSYLRVRPHVPIAAAYIPWHGPWVRRWAGRDTDLFFIFSKFYTDLVCRFLPDDASPEETIATPGWILVQAQMLTILDSTMQQSNNVPAVEQLNGPSSITFDDMLGEADATATLLPLPATGAMRSMAENRLIMLLRDCLSNSAIMVDIAQALFAQSFSRLIKGAARKISLFDPNACFTLCDFLEEAIPILTRYYQSAAATAIDWSFWLDVCKRMLQSQNTLTDIRVCSFLYSMWPTIISDGDRKSEVCLNWLLSRDTFQGQFCHWCPMVRAFYMRLLVWRIGRLDGSNAELDAAILKTLSERLQETWRHFLHIKAQAEQHSVAAPSTLACSPAPGRRLYIVRDDVQPAPSGMFLSFDGILSTGKAANANPYRKHSSRDPSAQRSTTQLTNGMDYPNRSSEGGNKRWSLFRGFIPRSVKTEAESQKTRVNGIVPKTSPTETRKADHSPDTPPMPSPTYRSLSFKFSLEWAVPDSNRERRLSPPKLPLPALISFKALSASSFSNENINENTNALDHTPLKPEASAVGPSRYASRALAEWAMLVVECQNFFERRRAEGVPVYQMVETPTLGVENFRKI